MGMYPYKDSDTDQKALKPVSCITAVPNWSNVAPITMFLGLAVTVILVPSMFI